MPHESAQRSLSKARAFYLGELEYDCRAVLDLAAARSSYRNRRRVPEIVIPAQLLKRETSGAPLPPGVRGVFQSNSDAAGSVP